MSSAGTPPSAINDGTVMHVQWSALFAGAVAASGISFTLLAFGAGIGLAVASSSPSWRDSSATLWFLSGLWLVLIALCAFGLGGYLTGRLRAPLRLAAEGETEFRDGLHGIIMWGLAVLMTALVGIGGAMVFAPAVAPQGAGTSVAGETIIAADVDELLRSTRPTADAGMAWRRAEVSRILLKANSRTGVSSDDRNYLASIVSDRSEVSRPEAAAITERVIGNAAVDLHRARVAAVIQAFMITAGLLLGAAVAWYSAVEGGRERQRGTLPVWDWRFATRRPIPENRP